MCAVQKFFCADNISSDELELAVQVIDVEARAGSERQKASTKM